MTLDIIVLVILILLSAVFSGTEMAFFSLSQAQVQALVNKGKRFSNLVSRLKDKPQRLLITILLGNNFVNIAASILAATIIEDVYGSRAIGYVTGIMTFLILVFGEIVPKSFAQVRASRYALNMAPVMQLMMWVLFPVVWLLEVITAFASRRTSAPSPIVYKEELKAMLQMGVKEKELEQYESELIERTLHFDDLSVKDVMTPWKKVVALDGDVAVSQISHFVSKSDYARFPVFLKRKDNIVGFVHLKQIFATLKSDKRDDPVNTIVQALDIVPETMMIDALFHQMKRNRFRLVLVKNINEKLIGIVTMRDLTEEIIGDYPAPADGTHDYKPKQKTAK